MVAFCLLLLFVLLFVFSVFVDSFVNFFPSRMVTMSFAGYFLVRSLLSAFPSFLRKRIPGLIWFGSVYLVTTAGVVAIS